MGRRTAQHHRPHAVQTGSGPRRVMFAHDNVEFGGIETLQLAILARLDPERVQASVVVTRYDGSQGGRFEESLRAAGVPMVRPPPVRVRPPFRAVATVVRLTTLLRQHRPDVVHIQTRTPTSSRQMTVAAALARVRVLVRTEHVSPGPHCGRWTHLAVKPFDALTDAIVVDSHADRREQITLLKRNARKVVTSYCGIDPSPFRPDHDRVAAKRALGLADDTTVVGTVGRLHVQKGHRYLIEAIPTILAGHDAPIVFLIVGDGPDELELRTLAASHGVAEHVRFAGFQADALPFMEAMDVAVMPSLWEGFSISMQEFMALGTPMVVSDHPSFLEAIEDGVHGLIVPMRDPGALADGVLTCLRDPDRAAAMGAAAAARVRGSFSLAAHVEDLTMLYQRLWEGGDA